MTAKARHALVHVTVLIFVLVVHLCLVVFVTVQARKCCEVAGDGMTRRTIIIPFVTVFP